MNVSNAHVDPEARRRAADLIRRYVAGAISNDVLHDEWPIAPDDAALRGVGEVLWHFYSDLKTHSFAESKPNGRVRDLFEKCAAFLETQQAYTWPTLGLGWKRVLVRFLTLGIADYLTLRPVRKALRDGLWPG